jgi:hypothetical protein
MRTRMTRAGTLAAMLTASAVFAGAAPATATAEPSQQSRYSTGSAPAAALAPLCQPQNRRIALPGKPDVDVVVQMCIGRNGRDDVVATANIFWDSNGQGIGGRRFDKFVAIIRLEQNNAQKRARQCNLVADINNEEAGLYTCTVPPWPEPVRSGGWTADGVIWYDPDGDGEGPKKWELHGSPVLD